jgi:hypothetical protein
VAIAVGNRVKLLWGVLIAGVHGHPMERLLAQIRGGLAPFSLLALPFGVILRNAMGHLLANQASEVHPEARLVFTCIHHPPSGRSTRVVMVWISRANKASICARSPTSCARLALGAELGLNLLELHAELLQLLFGHGLAHAVLQQERPAP